MDGVNFSKSTFINCDFTEASVIATNFSGALFIKANFTEADLRGAIFRNVRFKRCQFNFALEWYEESTSHYKNLISYPIIDGE